MVVIDAESDPEYGYSEIANLARKARIDFGAEIEFLDEHSLNQYVDGEVIEYFGTLEQLRRGRWSKEPVTDRQTGQERLPVEDAAEDRLSLAHAALARVRYHDEPERVSYLILIKPSPSGDEPADVLSYHSEHPAFPQETTADQFFDEAQWESYRKLGEHIGQKLFTYPAQAGNFPEAGSGFLALQPPNQPDAARPAPPPERPGDTPAPLQPWHRWPTR